ncbi:MAG: GGDEF domain-containing protein, partial [Rhodospirillales bacterium]|nr:GGDEF domain-containing protein [Rhodospirillales bacterium]
MSPFVDMAKQKTTTDVPVSEDEDHAQINEALRRRVHELEDFQQRVEADAAKTIEIAEELVIARDQAKTALKQSQEYQQTIQKLALYDPLTGVANRNEFNRRFEDAIRVSKRDDSVIAVMLFDLDHFKEINDSYGHPVGDALLKFVAEHMMDATRETDTVARLGGDEFAIILTGLDEEERATGVAERVIGILSQPITLDGCMLNTGTSIGISLYPRDGEDSEELLRTGDKALYKAKSRGRGG